MSKFFSEFNNKNLEEILSILQSEILPQNYPNVVAINNLQVEDEEVLEELCGKDNFIFYTDIGNYKATIDYGFKIMDLDNLDNNLKEVDLGLRTDDGKKILFADRNLCANDPKHEGGQFQWASIEGVIGKPTEPEQIKLIDGTIKYMIINGKMDTDTAKQYLDLLTALTASGTLGENSDLSYDKNDYKYYDSSSSSFTKYNKTDGLINLQSDDDVVNLLGDTWMIPSDEIMTKLVYSIKTSDNDTQHPLSLQWKLQHKETKQIVYKPGYAGNIVIRPTDTSNLTHKEYSLVVDDINDVKDNYTVLGIKIINEKLSTSIYLPLKSSRIGIPLVTEKSCGYWTTHVGTKRPSLLLSFTEETFPTESCAISYDLFNENTSSVAFSRDNTYRYRTRYIRPVKIVE